MVKIKEVEGAIEAILFTMGESVELSRIAKAVEVDPKTTEKIIHNMMDRYQEEGRGIQIIELENSFQMCTEEFLRSFGVQDLDELPVPDPVQIEDFKAEAEEEVQLKLDV